MPEQLDSMADSHRSHPSIWVSRYSRYELRIEHEELYSRMKPKHKEQFLMALSLMTLRCHECKRWLEKRMVLTCPLCEWLFLCNRCRQSDKYSPTHEPVQTLNSIEDVVPFIESQMDGSWSTLKTDWAVTRVPSVDSAERPGYVYPAVYDGW